MADISYSLEVLRVTRTNVINFIEGLSYEELTKVPSGFNNSILWNAVHNLTVQQLLCYKLSGLSMNVPNKFIEGYTKGADGKSAIAVTDLDEFKSLFISTIDLFSEDYSNGKFKTFTEYTTSYNITLKSVEDVINFNNTHEGLHFGYMMALKRAL
jgi:hypothetical protein